MPRSVGNSIDIGLGSQFSPILLMLDFANFFLLFCYFGLCGWIGSQICKRIGIEFQSAAAQWVFGYLLIELAGLLFFFGVSRFLGANNFAWAFAPILLAVLILFIVDRSNAETDSVGSKSRYGIWPVVAMSFVLLFIAAFPANWDQTSAALSDNGVIYQDIVFHSGISRSMREFGFPIADLQYLDNEIRYHIYTHFIVAKISSITSWNETKSTLFVLPYLTIFGYSIAAASFFLPESGKLRATLVSTAYVIAPVFLSLLAGGRLTSEYIFVAMFSFSFAWQVIISILFLDYAMQIGLLNKNQLSLNRIAVVCVFVVLATLTKGSSLPLMLCGLGVWLVVLTIVNRQIFPLAWLLVFTATIAGLSTYILFFQGSSLAKSTLVFSVAGFRKTLWASVSNKLSITLPAFLQAIILLFSIISFRLIAFRKPKNPIVWFWAGYLMAGTGFYFFYSNNPNYFLFPALFLGNLVTLKVIRKSFFDFHWITKIEVVLLVALTLYPVATGGSLSATNKLEWKKEVYFPLTPERVELFDMLAKISTPEDIVFTSSIYSNERNTPDNFYPAAYSGRRFFVGGYRFSASPDVPEVSKRLNLVDNFSLRSRQHTAALKENGVSFVIIENQGNAKSAFQLDDDQNKSLAEGIAQDYKVEFRNSAGAILSLLGSD